jgi:ubiquinone/menaquinone biosynthesis C-methylase UbiE
MLERQFSHPAGLPGRAVGRVMALLNGPMNRLAVDLLAVRPDDAVLEIGFGPGTAIRLLAERAVRGFVAGADPSDVMVREAVRRNRVSVEAGRVDLRRASVSRLPYPDGRFTKVLAVNSFHHWPAWEDDLREVRRVTKAGGILLLGEKVERPLFPFLTLGGLTAEEIAGVEALLQRTGFRDVETVRRTVWGVREVAFVTGRK